MGSSEGWGRSGPPINNGKSGRPCGLYYICTLHSSHRFDIQEVRRVLGIIPKSHTETGKAIMDATWRPGVTVTAGRVMTQVGCLSGKGHGMDGCCTIVDNLKAAKMWDCTTSVPGGPV
jgi:hypothetical protein